MAHHAIRFDHVAITVQDAVRMRGAYRVQGVRKER